jgi:outer membrane cobalamin receptor
MTLTLLVALLQVTTSDSARTALDSARLITKLTPQRIVADRVSAPAGRTQVAMSVGEARTRGVVSMNGLLSQLPYMLLRSARGETGVSLRGARREQVVVTLDGLPLNDPATGVADVSDLPLVTLQTVAVVPGADPVGSGSGANGGVLALTTAAQRALAANVGAFGQQAVEGAWVRRTPGLRLNATAAWRTARNDFRFLNDAGVSSQTETRVNNDERRAVVGGGVVSARAQWSVLASFGERGMVGPANVRTYDADRSRVDRVVVRGQHVAGSTLLTAGVRWFSLGYRDPTRPALDARAQAAAADVEWRGAWRGGAWRTGLGADGLRATGNIAQQRLRGFAAYGWQHRHDRLEADLAVRADAIEQAGVLPTASAGVSWRALGARETTRLSLLARGAQAVRVPTLYDLYFSSPQRLFVQALDPERVLFDVSTGARFDRPGDHWQADGEVMLVARDTRDAIIWFPGNFGWSPANVGREQLRGAEARAALRSAWLSVSAWATLYGSELHTGGLRIPAPYVPRASGGAQAQWRHPLATLSGNARVQGPRPYTAGPRNPDFELPAVALVDIAMARTVEWSTLHTLVTISLDNVTNTRWQSVRGFPMPGRAWSLALTLQPRR